MKNSVIQLMSTAASVAVLLLGTKVSEAVTISATASGSPTPPQIPVDNSPVTIINGDFTITDSSGFNEIAGNGINESTTWNFNFSNNSNLNLFTPSTQLSSALFTLTINPKQQFVTTDTTGIGGGISELVNVLDIPNVPPVGETGTITFDLLDFGFSQTTLLTVLNADSSKTIPWFYQDDAIISFAQLDLTTETVPEPSSILGLLAFGAFGIGSRLNRK